MSASSIVWFADTRVADIARVGGKGANLGEMTAAGMPVPPGFVVSALAYTDFMQATGLDVEVAQILDGLDTNNSHELERRGALVRQAILDATMPEELAAEISMAYRTLSGDDDIDVAVRSSATAEDLPDASFAGQQETKLNISGEAAVVVAVQQCWASLYGDRAIYYRFEQGFEHSAVALAVVVQQMIQPDVAGVMFSVDPLSGNPDRIVIDAGRGIGEAVVGGEITPDNYVVSKSDLAILSREVKPQYRMLVKNQGADGDPNVWVDVPPYLVGTQKLADDLIVKLAEVGRQTEEYYGHAVDMEWVLVADEIYVVQARPVTVHSNSYQVEEGELEIEPAPLLLTGQGASPGVGVGQVRILEGPHQCDLVREGDILVAHFTTPDYVPAMKRAAAILTEEGGRTCHAAIVSRELGVPAIVGASGATHLSYGSIITVDANHGDVFEGVAHTRVAADERRRERQMEVEAEMQGVKTRTKVYVILAEPDEAMAVAERNVDGVGLLRMEIVLGNIGKHPKQFLAEGTQEEYIGQIAEALRTFCKAFGDRPVVLRLMDFKTNELANLVGGQQFEDKEENPMLGYRGAARYTREREVFALEVEAIKRVREEYSNLHVMVPFVRTPAELREVIDLLAELGLQRSADFQLWMMAELPTNALLLDEYIDQGIDGVSIGSNDLTQLTLGLDRDGAKRLKGIGDERDPAVMKLMEMIVRGGVARGITVGICGQAPSDFPEITEKLVEWGATSISVTPDRLADTRKIVQAIESQAV